MKLIVLIKYFSPIFAEIVPEKHRTSIYALDCSFESVLNSFAPPLVGILAQHVYGYKPIPEGSSESTVVKTDRENATALAKALDINFTITMSVCCFIYSFLYCTYPTDRDRARLQGFVQSEAQLMEGSHSGKLEFQVLENKDFEDVKAIIVELENEENRLLRTQEHVLSLTLELYWDTAILRTSGISLYKYNCVVFLYFY